MASSIFWYDLETTGINTRADRIMQVAGIRTNEQLEQIGEPLNLYCKLSEDILPHPQASLVTGIEYETLQQQGLPEAEFIRLLHQELIVPQTCSAGFNSIRFDDEFTRNALYRNFYDPYAREWQGGNSRWDLLDALRCAWALRPEGIVWPVNDEGKNSFRLELLTAANGIEHGQAHDALADVRATIAMAQLLRKAQPRLFEFLFGLRHKNSVQQQIRIGQPLLHVSGRIPTQRHCLSIALPLQEHPSNRNAIVVCDLLRDVQPLLELDVQQLQQRLYTSSQQLAEQGLAAVPLKLLHINRCPVVAPLSVLRDEDKRRLEIDDQVWQQRLSLLQQNLPLIQEKLQQLYGLQHEFEPNHDPEQQLYNGFLSERDRGLCQQVLTSDQQQLAQQWSFADQRLPELLFRYRARNYPTSLSTAEQSLWHEFCKLRLTESEAGAPLTLDSYIQEFEKITPEQKATTLMQGWRSYVASLADKYQQ